MARGLLYLGSEGEQLYRIAGDRLQPVEAGTAFDELLVVVDVVEESLVRVTLPRMFGRDMAALVERRLQQEFRETPYRASVRLGPGKADKQVDYLFQGLPLASRLDAQLKPWLARHTAIPGVYSVSALAVHWAQRLGLPATPRLIVLPTPAGVRYILLDRGQAVLSRLTATTGLEREEAAQALADEVERTVQYLYNARLVERGSEVPTWIWGTQPAALALAGRRITGIRFEATPPGGRHGDPAQDGLDALLRLATQTPPGQQLAPDPVRLYHAARVLRRGLIGGAALLAAALLGIAVMTLFEAWDLQGQIAATGATRSQLERSRDALAEAAARAEVDAETVRGTVAAWQRELAGLPTPEAALLPVSAAFDAAPAFRLDRLQWQVLGGDAASVDGSGGSSCPEPWPEDPETGSRPSLPRVGLRLQGEVDGGLGLREAVEARRRFEAALAAIPGFGVRTEAAPIDPSGGVIRGGSQDLRDTRGFDYCLSAEAPP